MFIVVFVDAHSVARNTVLMVFYTIWKSSPVHPFNPTGLYTNARNASPCVVSPSTCLLHLDNTTQTLQGLNDLLSLLFRHALLHNLGR